MMLLLFVLALGVAIAFANGSNDVSKGVATLVGSGVCDLQRAIRWGVFWTGLGSLFSTVLAHAMLKTFGAGLFAAGERLSLAAALATIAGATLWVALSSWRGWPVSTTHAILGSIAGVGLLAYGVHGIRWSSFTSRLVLPLLLSPVVALVLTAIFVRFWSAASPEGLDCLCVQLQEPAMAAAGVLTSSLELAAVPFVQVAACNETSAGGMRLSLNHLHWLTSAGTSFARGLNDSPKMVALLLAAAALGTAPKPAVWPFALAVASGIILGSWLAGKKVTLLLAHGVTRMNHREGFVANLVTAGLVGPGAALGLPMSTTHVAAGAIMGLAFGQGKAVERKVVLNILLAWVVTLPLAAAFGMAVFLALHTLAPHLIAYLSPGAR